MKRGKALAVVGSFVTAAILGGSANAAISVDNTTDKNVVTPSGSNTITVSSVGANDTFTICKIVDVKYDSSTNSVSYAFTPFMTAFLGSTYGSNYSSLTPSQYVGYSDGTSQSAGTLTGNTNIDNLAGAIASYARNTANATSSCGTMTVANSNATYTTSTAGGYIILPTSTTNVYSTMIANIDVQYNSSTGQYDLDTSHASTLAKKSGPVADLITKTATTDGTTEATTFNIGENIIYSLDIDVPSYPYNATNTKIKVSDKATYHTDASTTASRGTIEFDTTNAPVVKVGNTTCSLSGGDITCSGNVVGTYTYTSSLLEVTFNNTKDLGETDINITYVGKLTSATPANVSQSNGVELEYPQDVYDSNSAVNTQYDQASVKTLGLKIKKSDGAQSPEYLSGAEFELYADQSMTQRVTCYTYADASGANAAVTDSGATIVVNDNNDEEKIGICRGIKAGTYWLKETKAPTGYNISSTNPTQVTLTENGATEGIDANNDGSYVSPEITTGYQRVTVENPAAVFGLPFTGGRGVAIYAIVGVGIVSIASAYYIRKKQEA